LKRRTATLEAAVTTFTAIRTDTRQSATRTPQSKHPGEAGWNAAYLLVFGAGTIAGSIAAAVHLVRGGATFFRRLALASGLLSLGFLQSRIGFWQCKDCYAPILNGRDLAILLGSPPIPSGNVLDFRRIKPESRASLLH